jgi:hypothetical protein
VVLDGHEKNNRKHCKASSKVGSENVSYCEESPLQGSYFCLAHNSNCPLDNSSPKYDGIYYNFCFLFLEI